MCFGDDRTYKTRTYVANGARVQEEYTVPRHGRSWRRRYGLGGSYYPPRYYNGRPSGRYANHAIMHGGRYPPYTGHPQYSHPARYGNYAQTARYSQAIVPAHQGYSSGYGRYQPGAHVAMPHHAAMVRNCSITSLPSSHLPSSTPHRSYRVSSWLLIGPLTHNIETHELLSAWEPLSPPPHLSLHFLTPSSIFTLPHTSFPPHSAQS